MARDNCDHQLPESILDESSPSRLKRRYHVSQQLASDEFGDVEVLSCESADRALTPVRRSIINAISHNEIESQNQLSDVLGRDPGNLKRDLAVLIDEGIVGREKEGKSYRPYLKYDTILTEPVPHP